MYFDLAEQKLQDLDAAVTDLQNATGVDLAPLQADIVALQDAMTAANAALAALDARLDAISAGAQG